nr:hypothetical protein RVX_0608 [Nitratidesulfovibrio sp. HK-II]
MNVAGAARLRHGAGTGRTVRSILARRARPIPTGLDSQCPSARWFPLIPLDSL